MISGMITTNVHTSSGNRRPNRHSTSEIAASVAGDPTAPPTTAAGVEGKMRMGLTRYKINDGCRDYRELGSRGIDGTAARVAVTKRE